MSNAFFYFKITKLKLKMSFFWGLDDVLYRIRIIIYKN